MKLLVGATALEKLGSSRKPKEVYYLINNEASTEAYLTEWYNGVPYTYLNANGLAFFKEIAEREQATGGVKEIASPQSLLELSAFFFVQHQRSQHWQQADGAEFDIKFLVRQFNLKGFEVVNKYITPGELSSVEGIIKNMRW